MADVVEPGVFHSDSQCFERILSVDVHRDLPKDGPASLEDVKRLIRWEEPLVKLPSYIPDLQSYHRSFFPLYMIECLQMLTSHKYKSMSYPARLQPLSCSVVGTFAYVQFCSDVKIPCSPGDIVLLYVGKVGEEDAASHDVVMKPAPLIGGAPDESTQYVSVPPDHPIFEDTLRHALAYVEVAQHRRCTLKVLILPPSFASFDTFDYRSIDRLEVMQTLLKVSATQLNSKGDLSEALPPTDGWYLSKILSFSTALREFRALCMMRVMPLRPKLLSRYEGNPSSDPPAESANKGYYLSQIKIPPKLRHSLEASFNAGQLRAIRNSLNDDGITLIQGPPGTGKTTTIIGIISAILESDDLNDSLLRDVMELDGSNDSLLARNPWLEYSEYSDDSVDVRFDDLNAADADMDIHGHRYDSYACIAPSRRVDSGCVKVPMRRHSNRRILICAPSNAAIDEIVKRLVRPVSGGIFNAEGVRYNPTVTRIGPNFHDDIRIYSLKYKVDRLIYLRGWGPYMKVESHIRQRMILEILLESDIVCSTLSACGSSDLYSCLNMFDTLIVDEATQAVELSTLIALCLGCKRAIFVGDPCQLSATVCSNVAVSLNYDRSLFQRLQVCGYPVNLLNIQYRMDPRISRFPSMYFYKNQLTDAPNVYERNKEDWREFPLLRPTVFYALDSQQTQYETSYMNEMEADIVCQLLDILLEVLSCEPGFVLQSLAQRIAVITTYSAQVSLLREAIGRRHKVLVAPQEKDESTPGTSGAPKPPKLLIDVSSVDGFQGMEKEIVIFSAVRTSYTGKRKVAKQSLEELTMPGVLTIDREPHHPDVAAQFAKVSSDYMDGIKSGRISSDIQDIVDVSFIADRRRINVAITRACRNLFIVGNPRFLLEHTHWYSLYHHYAQCGYIFLCNLGNSASSEDFLKSWARCYLMKDPEAHERFLRNPYLRSFVTKVTS